MKWVLSVHRTTLTLILPQKILPDLLPLPVIILNLSLFGIHTPVPIQGQRLKIRMNAYRVVQHCHLELELVKLKLLEPKPVELLVLKPVEIKFLEAELMELKFPMKRLKRE